MAKHDQRVARGALRMVKPRHEAVRCFLALSLCFRFIVPSDDNTRRRVSALTTHRPIVAGEIVAPSRGSSPYIWRKCVVVIRCQRSMNLVGQR